MAAGGNIYLAIWGRSGHFLPPVDDRALLLRAAHIVSAAAAVIAWYLLNDAILDSAFALLLFCVAVFVPILVLYAWALAGLTVRCPSDPVRYLGGLWTTGRAKAEFTRNRQEGGRGPTSAEQFFCNNGRDPGPIWSPRSRTAAELLLTLSYILLIFAATATVTSIWMAGVEQFEARREKAAPPEQPPQPPELITVPADILFAYGKADLAPNATRALRDLADRLRRQSATSIEITGHTDARGSDEANRILSERRAAAVAEWLAVNACLGAIRITSIGLGETKPVATNVQADGGDNPAGRARNRRVEIRYKARGAEFPAAPCPGENPKTPAR